MYIWSKSKPTLLNMQLNSLELLIQLSSGQRAACIKQKPQNLSNDTFESRKRIQHPPQWVFRKFFSSQCTLHSHLIGTTSCGIVRRCRPVLWPLLPQVAPVLQQYLNVPELTPCSWLLFLLLVSTFYSEVNSIFLLLLGGDLPDVSVWSRCSSSEMHWTLSS